MEVVLTMVGPAMFETMAFCNMVHPLASDTLMVYVPAVRFVMLLDIDPLLHEYE